MRYVYLVVAIGVLVVGTGAYTTQAAQGQATASSRLIYGLGLTKQAGHNYGEAFKQARATYTARKEEERKNNEALAHFGEWGPELVKAGETYGQNPADLHRVMMCESGGNPLADNGTHKGLFQFHPQTWAGTPFGSGDINDGKAQVHAAAWMWSQGRKGEWECV